MKYCLQLLSFEQLCSLTGGFGFTPVDSNWLCSNDPATGFGAGVYHDYIGGDNLLTFRGTDPTSIVDWHNNCLQALVPPADQYIRAMTLARNLQTIWNNPQRPTPSVFTPTTPSGWSIAGHSLGGGLAAAASIVSSFPAMTFNAAGVNYLTIQLFDNTLGINSQAQLDTRSKLVTSYVVTGEVLNYAQDGYLAQELGLTWLIPIQGHASKIDRKPYRLGQWIYYTSKLDRSGLSGQAAQLLCREPAALLQLSCPRTVRTEKQASDS